MSTENSSSLKLLSSTDDVDSDVLDLVEACVSDWYSDIPMPTSDFIDTLCYRYGNGEGWDIENLDTSASRKIMRHARKTKSEL